ncbi:hypothetical protein DACRYDRAFT_18704 [Dacryopinax primogenitus]|uniref:Uncharacterized protein n=1 Tax=Dacryopinax primogenitus (strain DJM 731) TaxID=1858805 RepID=M5FPS8_DACPD|nr:uncharacterized protein DACRYDRAFT_18704 [Dacryopinax primogenitus]EJT97288.1 hypothetical protein DACRYDRAFT_18704 [Dacryopinax primogenitus]
MTHETNVVANNEHTLTPGDQTKDTPMADVFDGYKDLSGVQISQKFPGYGHMNHHLCGSDCPWNALVTSTSVKHDIPGQGYKFIIRVAKKVNMDKNKIMTAHRALPLFDEVKVIHKGMHTLDGAGPSNRQCGFTKAKDDDTSKIMREKIVMFDKLTPKELEARELSLARVQAQDDDDQTYCTPSKQGTSKNMMPSHGGMVNRLQEATTLGKVNDTLPVKVLKMQLHTDRNSSKGKPTNNTNTDTENGKMTNFTNITKTTKTKLSHAMDFSTDTDNITKSGINSSSMRVKKRTMSMHPSINTSGLDSDQEWNQISPLTKMKTAKETKAQHNGLCTRSQSRSQKKDPLTIIWKMESTINMLKEKHSEVRFGTLINHLKDLATILSGELKEKKHK